jgi:S1-C subfamily serine protease
MKRIGLSIAAVGVIATAALVLVVLIAVGALPTTTNQVVVQKQVAVDGGGGGATQPAAQIAGQLTPSEIYQKYSPGVVEVRSTFPATQNFFGQALSSQALGSGFVVSPKGFILTNAHVVVDNGQKAKSVKVVFKLKGTQTQSVAAKVMGVDETSDVAVLKVDPAKTPALVPIPIGNSSAVQVGETVVAIGNPLGYDFSLTEGIVSATNRNLQSPNGSTISNGIQTDAAINEGNSGGPLINTKGEVIGINEQIASQSGGNQGLGFAVPINTASSVMKQIESTGTVKYAYLGVQGQTVTADVAKELGVKSGQGGVLVAQSVSGGPAAKSGIKGGGGQKTIQGVTYVTGGDLLTAMNGTKLTSMEQLAGLILQHKPGDVVTLKLVRGSQTLTVKATLAVRPNNF